MILMNPVCLFSFLYCLISHSGCHLAPSSTGMWHLRHSPGFSFTLSFENPLCSAIGLFHDNPPDVRNVWSPHNQAGFYPSSWLASRQAGWSLQGVVKIQIPSSCFLDILACRSWQMPQGRLLSANSQKKKKKKKKKKPKTKKTLLN